MQLSINQSEMSEKILNNSESSFNKRVTDNNVKRNYIPEERKILDVALRNNLKETIPKSKNNYDRKI